jgi:hypothetical protein
MTLQQNDMVVWYINHPDEIEWDNPGLISRSLLYRVGKFTGANVYLAQAHRAKVNLDTAKFPHKIVKSYTGLTVVKVRIDRLGELHLLEDMTAVQGA